MKPHQSEWTIDRTLLTRDGRLSTRTRPQFSPRDLMKTSALRSIDHSTSSQDCQLTEFLNIEVATTCTSSNGSWTEANNNGYLMNQEQSSQLQTRDIAWASRATEEATTLELKVLTQDGGRCSDTKMATSSTRKVRSLMFTAHLMLRTDRSSCGTSTTEWTNNGTSCT